MPRRQAAGHPFADNPSVCLRFVERVKAFSRIVKTGAAIAASIFFKKIDIRFLQKVPSIWENALEWG